MVNHVFSLWCSGESSEANAWELALGDRSLRQHLAAGDTISFMLEDGTSVCLKMASDTLLLAESVTSEGKRGITWYRADQFMEDEEKLTACEFLRQIYLRARRQKPENLLGAFVE